MPAGSDDTALADPSYLYDFDTASLLIALLRASGIPAKYVYGTIELPIEKVKNWAGGFTDTMSALNMLLGAV